MGKCDLNWTREHGQSRDLSLMCTPSLTGIQMRSTVALACMSLKYLFIYRVPYFFFFKVYLLKKLSLLSSRVSRSLNFAACFPVVSITWQINLEVWLDSGLIFPRLFITGPSGGTWYLIVYSFVMLQLLIIIDWIH